MEELKWRPSGWTCPMCDYESAHGKRGKCPNCEHEYNPLDGEGRYGLKRIFLSEEYKVWKEGMEYRASNK